MIHSLTVCNLIELLRGIFQLLFGWLSYQAVFTHFQCESKH